MTSAVNNKASRLALRNYQRSYCKDGEIDRQHLTIFSALKKDFFDGNTPMEDSSIPKVLYPGCHRHITPSLVFPDVNYVDFDKKVSDIFDIENNAFTREWIMSHKEYADPAIPKIRFVHSSYAGMKEKRHKLQPNSFDLLISLSAGIVTHDGLGFLRQGGYYLVNASHSDALVAHLQPSLRLRAYWDDEEGAFCQDDTLDDLFQARQKGSKKRSRDADGDGYMPISKDQVDEAVRIGSKSKRSFVLKREPMMYVFEKVDVA